MGVLLLSGLVNATESSHVKNPEGSSMNSKHLIQTEIKHYENLLSDAKHSNSPAAQSIVSYYEGYKKDLEYLFENIKSTDDVKDRLYQVYKKHNPDAAGGYHY